jgi:hypothetical protein
MHAGSRKDIAVCHGEFCLSRNLRCIEGNPTIQDNLMPLRQPHHSQQSRLFVQVCQQAFEDILKTFIWHK